MEKKYPYLSEDGKTIFLAPGYQTETKETWEKREQLPNPPEEIYIPPLSVEEIDALLDEEIESVRELKVYDVKNMTQEEFDAFLSPYMK